MEQIVLIVGYIVAIIGFILMKKTNKKESIVVWTIISIILMMCFHTMISSILLLFKIKYNTYIYGITDFILGIIFIGNIVKNKKHQELTINWVDVLAVITILLVGTVIFIKEFTIHLNIAYVMADPAAHFKSAMEIIRNGNIAPMSFSPTNNALFISLFEPLIKNSSSLYKVFILSEGAMLFLSGGTIYILLKKFMDKKGTIVVGLIFIAMYIAGYPTNNMLYGFNYLGMCVSLTAVLIYLLNQYYLYEINDKLLYPILSMVFLSVSLCYSLFAPALWIIGAYVIAKRLNRDGKLFAIRNVIIFLIIFFIPTVLTIKFCYVEFFVNTGINVTAQVNTDGGMYINYLSNFIIFVPLIVYGLYSGIKKKDNYTLNIFIIGWSSYMILAHILRIMKIMSNYYCFKGYYLLWLLCFVGALEGIRMLTIEVKKLIIIITSTIILTGIVLVSKIETPVFNNNPILDIYGYNYSYLNLERRIDDYSIDLFRCINSNIKSQTDKTIPFIMSFNNYARTYWYEGITGYDTIGYRTWDNSTDELITKMKNHDIDYVGIFSYDEEYLNYEKYLKKQEKIYENPSGAIYKIVE